jgi:hypothetical protein
MGDAAKMEVARGAADERLAEVYKSRTKNMGGTDLNIGAKAGPKMVSTVANVLARCGCRNGSG